MDPQLLVKNGQASATRPTRGEVQGQVRAAPVVGTPDPATTSQESQHHDACLAVARQATSAVMRAPAITIYHAAAVRSALCLMRRRHIRCLVVVDTTGRLCGMLTYRDIRRLTTRCLQQGGVFATADILQRIPVHEIMTHSPQAVAPETSVLAAGQLMVEYNIGGLPVVDSLRRVVGMVTERDVAAALVQQPDRGPDPFSASDPAKPMLEPQVWQRRDVAPAGATIVP